MSPEIQNLIREYRLWSEKQQSQKGGEMISVDSVVAAMASLYEKIRGVVDWREEHLLRKTAIERILKRRMLLNRSGKETAEPLLQELIRGGHFPNNSIPVDRVDEVQEIIDKYAQLIQKYGESNKLETLFSGMDDWLLNIAAVEIEETLAFPRKERALINYMTGTMGDSIRLKKRDEYLLTGSAKIYQVYIAVHRALFKLDDATISYHLLEQIYPGWHQLSQEQVLQIAQNLGKIRKDLAMMLTHPLGERFYRIAEQHDTSYLILNDIIETNISKIEEITQDASRLESEIETTYKVRLERLQGKIRRAAIYGVFSVFITKIALAFFLEIHVDTYLGYTTNLQTIGINIAAPVLLMLAFVLSTKTSTTENFQKVLVEVIKLLTQTERKDTYEISIPRKRRTMLSGIVYLFYLASFLISFGLIIWGLHKLQFSPFSIAIFLMFISLISFAGTRIRQRAQELMVTEERGGLFDGIFDIFSLPIIQVGKWLSGKIARYNVFVLALTLLIEVPFQLFVEFFEAWRKFLREKKEEIH